MKRRAAIWGLTLLGFTMLFCAFVQRNRITTLQAEHQRLKAQFEAGFQPPSDRSEEAREGTADHGAVTPELLQLREQVNRLTRQRQDLASIEVENQRLKSQLASGGPNNAPPLIRKSQAQFVGYGSPEDTLQSFLWAIETKNFESLIEAMTPEISQRFRQSQQTVGQSVEDLFKGTEMLVGLRILKTEKVADDLLSAEVEMSPDIPPQKIAFRRVAGQWKMSMPQ